MKKPVLSLIVAAFGATASTVTVEANDAPVVRAAAHVAPHPVMRVDGAVGTLPRPVHVVPAPVQGPHRWHFQRPHRRPRYSPAAAYLRHLEFNSSGYGEG